MKNEKGITLTSLIIYIIGLMIVMGTLSAFMNFFYRNINENNSSKESEEYSKLILYITNDINSKNIKKIYIDPNNSQDLFIKFNDGRTHEYSCQNGIIYYIEYNSENNASKKISICNEVESCSFTYSDSQITTNITTNGKQYNNTFKVQI